MKNKNPWVHYGTLISIYTIGALTLLMHTVFHFSSHNDQEGIVYAAQSCATIGKEYAIHISPNGFAPTSLTVDRCDVVSFTNTIQKALVKPAFGEHPHDIHYAGFPEKVLGFSQKESFVAHTPGTFSYHDHLKDSLPGGILHILP